MEWDTWYEVKQEPTLEYKDGTIIRAHLASVAHTEHEADTCCFVVFLHMLRHLGVNVSPHIRLRDLEDS